MHAAFRERSPGYARDIREPQRFSTIANVLGNSTSRLLVPLQILQIALHEPTAQLKLVLTVLGSERSVCADALGQTVGDVCEGRSNIDEAR